MTDPDKGPGEGPGGVPTPILFEARLTPHRSLSSTAFTLLMTAVIAVAFVAGAAFVALGAYPVTGFCGLELFLFFLLFRLNYRSATGSSEWIRLTSDRLEIVRRERNRETGRWSLQPYWLSVALEGSENDSGGAVLLRSHGRSLAIGRFLAPEERVRLREALALALARLREPRFDQGSSVDPRKAERSTL
jgi:uncharacterized membrane protein